MFFPAGHLRVWCLFFPTRWYVNRYSMKIWGICHYILSYVHDIFRCTWLCFCRNLVLSHLRLPRCWKVRWQHIVKWVNKHLERDHVLKSVEDFSSQPRGMGLPDVSSNGGSILNLGWLGWVVQLFFAMNRIIGIYRIIGISTNQLTI